MKIGILEKLNLNMETLFLFKKIVVASEMLKAAGKIIVALEELEQAKLSYNAVQMLSGSLEDIFKYRKEKLTYLCNEHDSVAAINKDSKVYHAVLDFDLVPTSEYEMLIFVEPGVKYTGNGGASKVFHIPTDKEMQERDDI